MLQGIREGCRQFSEFSGDLIGVQGHYRGCHKVSGGSGRYARKTQWIFSVFQKRYRDFHGLSEGFGGFHRRCGLSRVFECVSRVFGGLQVRHRRSKKVSGCFQWHFRKDYHRISEALQLA